VLRQPLLLQAQELYKKNEIPLHDHTHGHLQQPGQLKPFSHGIGSKHLSSILNVKKNQVPLAICLLVAQKLALIRYLHVCGRNYLTSIEMSSFCNSDTAEGWKRESGRRVCLAVSLGEVSRRDPGRPWSGGTIFRRQDNRGPASVELKYVGGKIGKNPKETGGAT
jgi:hypothetical protein